MHASTTKLVHMSHMDTIAAVWGPAGALTHLHYLATTAEKQANLSKTMDFPQLQQAGYAGWERPHSSGVALASPQGC